MSHRHIFISLLHLVNAELLLLQHRREITLCVDEYIQTNEAQQKLDRLFSRRQCNRTDGRCNCVYR